MLLHGELGGHEAPHLVRIEHNTMPPNGIELPAEAPLCHVAERQDVVIWPLSEVGPERKRASRPASTGLKS